MNYGVDLQNMQKMKKIFKRVKITLENKIKTWSYLKKLEDPSKIKWMKKPTQEKQHQKQKHILGTPWLGAVLHKKKVAFQQQHIECVYDYVRLL